MRKRSVEISASRLRRQFQAFEKYASQEKFKKTNESSDSDFQTKTLSKPKKLLIIASAKKLELLTPIKRQEKHSVQATSVSKLYAGSIDDLSISKINSSQDHVFEYSEKEEFNRYLSSLKKCSIFESELEMNFDACRSVKIPSDINLGLFYQLEEEIKIASDIHPTDFTSEVLMKSFSRFTRYLREILRALRYKSLEDEALTLEYLWRGAIKLVDSALIAQEIQNANILDRLRENTKFAIDQYRDELQKQNEKDKETEEKLNKKLTELRVILHDLKQENKDLTEKLNQKEGMLQELNDIDRFEVLRDTNRMLLNLHELIEEVTEEKLVKCQIYTNIRSPNKG